jgi:hypothetical protein
MLPLRLNKQIPLIYPRQIPIAQFPRPVEFPFPEKALFLSASNCRRFKYHSLIA